MMTDKITTKNFVRVAILQRVCTSYRAPLLKLLSQQEGYHFCIFFGDDLPNSKVKSGKHLSDFSNKKLATRFLQLAGRTLVWHSGLLSELAAFKPDVIICEGESNVLSYLQAMWFRVRHRHVKLVQWTLGGLPQSPPRSRLRKKMVVLIRSRFDAYIAYSSFGKQVLVDEGTPKEKIFVAVNVSDTATHLQKAERYKGRQLDARAELNIAPSVFACLFVGAIEANKKLGVLLEVFSGLGDLPIKLWVVGDGKHKAELEKQAEQLGIKNVVFVGRISEGLEKYYAAADLFLLPGRGGMVISEAMAYGLPVVASAADGTETDLIKNNENGLLLDSADTMAIRKAILKCSKEQTALQQWSYNARQQIEQHYNTNAMCKKVFEVIEYVREH